MRSGARAGRRARPGGRGTNLGQLRCHAGDALYSAAFAFTSIASSSYQYPSQHSIASICASAFSIDSVIDWLRARSMEPSMSDFRPAAEAIGVFFADTGAVALVFSRLELVQHLQHHQPFKILGSASRRYSDLFGSDWTRERCGCSVSACRLVDDEQFGTLRLAYLLQEPVRSKAMTTTATTL